MFLSIDLKKKKQAMKCNHYLKLCSNFQINLQTKLKSMEVVTIVTMHLKSHEMIRKIYDKMYKQKFLILTYNTKPSAYSQRVFFFWLHDNANIQMSNRYIQLNNAKIQILFKPKIVKGERLLIKTSTNIIQLYFRNQKLNSIDYLTLGAIIFSYYNIKFSSIIILNLNRLKYYKLHKTCSKNNTPFVIKPRRKKV
eukprot:TRINITY_DN1806_c1_g1_i6.p1 TRINITY_DN1806_c1_g1~~TRINITY_DN1806_c1_g1_i6.p1  ORF type:complete len:195 (+),score=-13.13 TRINITY_DN1806_c1_g1_i6:259-843(+)